MWIVSLRLKIVRVFIGRLVIIEMVPLQICWMYSVWVDEEGFVEVVGAQRFIFIWTCTGESGC